MTEFIASVRDWSSSGCSWPLIIGLFLRDRGTALMTGSHPDDGRTFIAMKIPGQTFNLMTSAASPRRSAS